jgi:serine-type D-Ala-D-Ala carboxypeptidase/endopeptidase (penicillin-binding protein 4)
VPPHEEDPLWPSDDSDTADGKGEGDGGATAQLPVPPPQTIRTPRPPQSQPRRQGPPQQDSAQPRSAQANAAQPNRMALSEQQTVWVQRPQLAPPPPSRQRPQPSQAPQPRSIPPASTAPAQPMRIEPSGEVRPAEVITAEPLPPPAEPPPPRHRKRRGLLVGGLALVLVIAVGVTLALPYVSNRLGLPWAPNLPKADSPQPAAVTLAVRPPSPSAPTPSDSGLSSALSGPVGNPALGTLTGIVIDPATDATMWDHNSTQALTPASATKLLTSTAALLTLDHGLQLTTKVVAGASPDTAILVAGGDPTLSALPDGQESVYPGAAHLDDLVAQVKQATGGTIKNVQIDLSIYSGALTAPGWAPDDAPSVSAAPVMPAMLDGGRTDPTANETSPRVANPATVLLQTFAQRLGASVAATSTTAAPAGARVLGEVRSAPLTDLVDNLLVNSDNNLAEAVGRQTAIANGAPPTFAGVAQTTLNVLAQNGFDTTGVSLNDGSGLSTLNKVPARLLAQLLAVVAAPDGKDTRTAKLRPLLAGLPVAGASGTLAPPRFTDPASSSGKGWVRAKTGTLSGVNTLAGLVLDKDGRVLVFALMSNGSSATTGRPALDAIAATLRGCGCR